MTGEQLAERLSAAEIERKAPFFARTHSLQYLP